MTEINNIEQIISSEVYDIDSQIRSYRWVIDNQGKFYDWNKPSIESAENNINMLIKKREVEAALIIENTKSSIKELLSKHGDGYIVVYSIVERYLGIHRDKCGQFNYLEEKDILNYFKCKTFNEANKKAYSLIEKVRTDINNGCEECKPYWNLSSIMKSL